MRITVFHVPFFRPENDEQNPAAIVHNIPCPEKDWIPVKDDNNSHYYQISTHDFKGGKCYQVAFRIDDSTPYKTEELSLHLDACIYRNSDVREKNDLYYDCENNLWYQRTCYKKSRTAHLSRFCF